MIRTLARTLMGLGCAVGSVCAYAQIDPPPPVGWDICINPTNTAPTSIPYIFITRANDLFRVTVGRVGTMTYGGTGGPCFDPAIAFNIDGGIGFGSGPVGSVQSNRDNDMMYTMGMPSAPGGNWSKAWLRRVDPTDPDNPVTTQFGPTLTGNFFGGASARYIIAEETTDGVQIRLRTDIVGDACSVKWDLTNLATTPQQLGIWYGATPAILEDGSFIATGMLGDAPVYYTAPGRKPFRVDTRVRRADDPANFPPYFQANFGQTTAYGLQVDLGPTESTKNSQGSSDATLVDEFLIGLSPFVIGPANAATTTTPPGDFVFGDVFLTDGTTQFLVKWEPQTGGSVATNQTRTIVSYFRNTWGLSKYARPKPPTQGQSEQPYSVVADAPHVVRPDDSGTGTNGLENNPFTVRVYIDNTGGYTLNNQSSRLDDVFITLNLPNGMSIANGDPTTQRISTVNPFQVSTVEWTVVADGIEIGDLPYSVTITSTPGPAQGITLNGTIRVAATKQLKLEPAANLVSLPWIFGDTSWDTVLGMTSPSDYTAYEWNPVQNSYVVSTSAKRSRAAWVILNPNTHPSTEVVPLNGATTPTDIIADPFTGTGQAPNTQLKGGWNLIGNPFPYAIPISDLVGVPASNPTQGFTFAQLVAQGIVTPYLAYWDPAISNYRFVQGVGAMLHPHRGYWLKVQTAQDLTLVWPGVEDTFVPGGRRPADENWVQSANHWRLMLRAAGATGQDQENYIGVATTGADALQIPEPPEGPTQDVTLSLDGAIANQNSRMAQVLSNRNGNLVFKAYVKSKKAGNVTISWPNLATLPSSIAVSLVDPVTNQAVNMRTRTSTQFFAGANSTKQFNIQVSSSAPSTQPLGSVLTANGQLSSLKPVTVTYGLNVDANVQIRVLNSAGTQIATVLAGVNRYQGLNTASWNLRNSKGALVAPGTYMVEVQATVDGVTVKKTASATVKP